MEADTSPEDWEAIERRLPEGKTFRLRSRSLYWAAAACVALLLGGGGVYLFRLQDTNRSTSFVEEPVRGVPPEVLPEMPSVAPAVSSFIARVEDIPAPPASAPLHPAEDVPAAEDIPAETPPREAAAEPASIPDAAAGAQETPGRTLIADAAPAGKGAKASSLRKWGFGTGIGGLTQGSGEVVNTYVLRSSSSMEDQKLLSLNAASDQNLGKTPKTNIRHRTPISFGLSVSRSLTRRLSLQSGLVYSLLISDWETQATAYNTRTRQTLHFVGVPLSLSYRIAEWNRFQVYAAAGVQADVNVAGQLREREYLNALQTGVRLSGERMKEWQWSAHARAGVSYPLIPHISAFAEMGAAYYFDNGSDIETLYSDKAFNLSPQIGFRLNF
jgi:hypothetical protein